MIVLSDIWTIYETRINVNGNTSKNRIVNNTLDTIKRNINPVNVKDVKVDGVTTQLVLKKSEKENEKFYYNLYNASTKLGSLIEYNNSIWLITYIEADKDVYEAGTLTQCNHLFKWQDTTGTIQSSYGIINNEFLKTVSDDKRVVNTVGKLQFILPYNETTSKIPFDKRFIIEVVYDKDSKPVPRVYKVGNIVSADTDYGNGKLLSLTVDVDEANENDNIDLMIADYHEKVTPTPLPTELKTVINGSNIIKSGGSSRTYNVIFYKEDDITEDTAITATWSYELPIGYEDKFVLTQNGNSIQIKILECDDLIGQSFKLKVSGSDDLHNAELQIAMVGLYG